MIAKDDRVLRIGVLGCGPIAQFAHFDACRKARNAELYAICDLADDLRERMAAVHQPHVAYADYERDAGRPDRSRQSSSPSPTSFTSTAALQALAAGKHVLVEKPLGTTVESCRELRDRAAAIRTGRSGRQQPPVRPGHRASPASSSARKWASGLRSKAWYYDSVYRYTMTDNLQPIPIASSQALRPEGDPKADRRRYFLLTHGSHLVDTARFLGGPIDAVSAPGCSNGSGAFCWFIAVDFADGSARPSRSAHPGAGRFPGRVPDLRRARQRSRTCPSALVSQVERRRVLLGSRPAVPPRPGRGCPHLQAADRGVRRDDPRRGAASTAPPSTTAWRPCRRWWRSPGRSRPANCVRLDDVTGGV